MTHLAAVNAAAEQGTLLFEVGTPEYTDARYIDTSTGEELVYWDQAEFTQEPELFHGLLIGALMSNATIKLKGAS